MFIFSNRKVSITNGIRLRTVQWSYFHSYIVVGGEEGTCKIMRIDPNEASKGFSAPKNMSMNQVLEGHRESVNVTAWNEKSQKLTTADSTGLIIVWGFNKGSWYEEMVNNRNKNERVTGMSWSQDGLMVAILFEEGSIIVGSVDGNRLWGKELKTRAAHCEWSPDNKLLIGIGDLEIHVYDTTGVFLMAISPQQVSLENLVNVRSNTGHTGRRSAFNIGSSEMSKLMGIKWSPPTSGFLNRRNLILGFESGKIHLMKDEMDEAPLIIPTGMINTHIEWNDRGTMIAVTGKPIPKAGTSGLLPAGDGSSPDKSKSNVYLKLYEPVEGTQIQFLKIPGKEITCCSFEKDSLRIVCSVDTNLLFANIRPEYKWCYFSRTLVHELMTPPHNLQDEYLNAENYKSLVFWDTKSNQKSIKSLKHLIQIAAHGQYCVYALKITQNSASKRPTSSDSNNPPESSLTLCNTIGSPVDSVDVEFPVHQLSINTSLVFAAGKESFITWRFTAPSDEETEAASELTPMKRKDFSAFKYDSEYDFDDSGIKMSTFNAERRKSSIFGTSVVTRITFVSKSDPIVCITSSDHIFVTGQKSGQFTVYLLPKVNQVQMFSFACHPTKISLNSDSSKLSVIETSAVLLVYDLEAENKDKGSSGKLMNFEKKDVWHFFWSQDDKDSFAMIERNKLMLFKDFECEESVNANGLIGSFEDLEIRTFKLDSLVHGYLEPSEDYDTVIDTKSLKDMKILIEKTGCKSVLKSLEDIVTHPRIWRLIADSALKQMDFETAELALVRLKDFRSIQFCKKVSRLQSDEMKKAEVFSYFGDFDSAEQILVDFDRRDLAIGLRKSLGHSLKVAELMKSDLGATFKDDDMNRVLGDAGDYLMDRLKFREALQLYKEADDLEKQFDASLALEDFDNMSHIIKTHDLTRADPIFLLKAAELFESVGMCDEAVDLYLKAEKADDAIHCCVLLNEWQTALKLAHENPDATDIDPILAKYSEHLLQKKKYFDIIELYRKANRIQDASSMILKIIEEIKHSGSSTNHPVYMKKLYCLIGTLYSDERLQQLKRQDSSGSSAGNRDLSRRRNTLTSLLREDEGLISAAASFRAIDNPWRGAEAYHFLILTNKQLYAAKFEAAMKTALNLRDYEEYIPSQDIYSIVALTALINQSFSIASRAFLKLETLADMSPERREEYQELSVSIFVENAPKEPKNLLRSECTYCETQIPDHLNICPACNTKFPICIASGRPIMDPNKTWTCFRCNHSAFKTEISPFNHCPLCHYFISK